MKKIFTVLSLWSMVFLASCNPFDNSSKPAEEIDAISSIGNGRTSLKLSVDAYIPAGNYCFFVNYKSFSQMKEELEHKNNEYRFHLLEDGIIVEQTFKDSIISYGIFASRRNNVFIPLEIDLQDEEDSYKFHKIIAPIQYSKVMLAAATAKTDDVYFPLMNDWYLVESNEEDYIKFYEDSHLFYIEKEEQGYKLKLKDNINGYDKIRHYRQSFSIEFKIEENLNFVKYDFVI